MTHRQIVWFGWTASILVLVLAFLQTRGGTVQAIAFVVGLPVILMLLVIALRGSGLGSRVQVDPCTVPNGPTLPAAIEGTFGPSTGAPAGQCRRATLRR